MNSEIKTWQRTAALFVADKTAELRFGRGVVVTSCSGLDVRLSFDGSAVRFHSGTFVEPQTSRHVLGCSSLRRTKKTTSRLHSPLMATGAAALIRPVLSCPFPPVRPDLFRLSDARNFFLLGRLFSINTRNQCEASQSKNKPLPVTSSKIKCK